MIPQNNQRDYLRVTSPFTNQPTVVGARRCGVVCDNNQHIAIRNASPCINRPRNKGRDVRVMRLWFFVKWFPAHPVPTVMVAQLDEVCG